METIDELQEQLDAKLDAVRSETDPKKAGEILKEGKAIRAKILLLQTNEKDLTELRSFSQDPVNRLPQPGEVLRSKKSGRTEIRNEDGKSVLYQEGEGLLSESQIRTVQSPEYADAFRAYIRRGGDLSRMPKDEMRNLVEGQDEQGGFLAPEEFIAKLLEPRPTPTRVAEQVTQLSAGSDRVVLPRNAYSADDTYSSGVRVQWTGEPGNPDKQNVTTFGQFAVDVHTAMLEVQATNNMIEDSRFPIMSYCAGKIRETWDIEKDKMVLLGSGVNQPRGILPFVGTEYGITSYNSGHATQLTADAILGITYDIPEQYLENQRFIFNRRSTEKAIALLKDDQKRYLFSTGDANGDNLANARPSQLVGFPFTRSSLMPDIAANAFPILHGDMRAYYWIQRVGITLQILNEIEARNNVKVILARVRSGGDLAEAYRLRAMKVAA